LASPGEPADLVAQYAEILSKPGKTGVVETYGSMFHGWMGARAKLDDEENRSEYERGYQQVAEFFSKHLSS
jgi:dienelactone hydrolase